MKNFRLSEAPNMKITMFCSGQVSKIYPESFRDYLSWPARKVTGVRGKAPALINNFRDY